MDRIRVAIVDDEPLIRRRVRRIIQNDPQVQIVGEFANGTEAMKGIQEHLPDLVFLDVQMPGMNGFQVLDALNGKLPYIVFVTAFDQYALQAFSVHALDYLVKPFSEERLVESLNRAKQRIHQEQTSDVRREIEMLLDELRAQSQYTERLALHDQERLWFIKTEDIDWIEAESKYAVLHVKGTEHIMREPLHSLEHRLNPRHFRRVNRSAIVNLERVKELQKWFHGDYRVVLYDGTTLTLSRLLKNQFCEALGSKQKTTE